MDPLSIVASCIAVLQATTASGKGLHRLWGLRKAPAELQALSNELEAMRGMLTVVQNTLRSIDRSELYRENREALEGLLGPVQHWVVELEALLEYRLKQSDKLDKHGRPKVDKSEWFRACSRIDRLKQNFRDARSNLDISFTGLNLQTSESIRRSVLQVQSITLRSFTEDQAAQSFRMIDSHFEDQDTFHRGHLEVTRALGDGIESIRTEQQAEYKQLHALLAHANDLQPLQHTLDAIRRENESSHKSLVKSFEEMAVELTRSPTRQHPEPLTVQGAAGTVHGSTLDKELLVCINATIATLQCPRLCRCLCHARQPFKTPRCLSSVIGQLMFSYTSLLLPRPCDYPPCRKSRRRSQFTYYFPFWAASKALMISSMTQHLSGPGATWSIKMPVVISYSRPVWRATRAANVGYLRRCFLRRQYTPYIVGPDGSTLLHFAVRGRSPLTYLYLVGLGLDPQMEDCYGRSAESMLLRLSRDKRAEYNFDEAGAAERMQWTALHVAIALPSPEHYLTPEMLRQECRDINVLDSWGRSPLHWACRNGNSQNVELLLQWKADVCVIDRSGLSALHLACAAGDGDSVAALLRHGASTQVTDFAGRTPLFLVKDAAPHVVTLLVDYGAELDTRGNDGRTALHHAAITNNVFVVEQLLQVGAHMITDARGHLPTHAAVIWNSPDALKMLLSWFPRHRAASLHVPVRMNFAVNTSNMRHGHKLTMPNLPPPLEGVRQERRPKGQQDFGVLGAGDMKSANLLHMAALWAGVKVMQILTDADLSGLDPLQETASGSTPDHCFYNLRDRNCYIIRRPFEEEEAVWRALMASARQQNGLGFEKWLICDGCQQAIVDVHFHCSICNSDDFDLCEACIALEKLCLDDKHVLSERFTLNGKIVSGVRQIFPHSWPGHWSAVGNWIGSPGHPSDSEDGKVLSADPVKLDPPNLRLGRSGPPTIPHATYKVFLRDDGYTKLDDFDDGSRSKSAFRYEAKDDVSHRDGILEDAEEAVPPLLGSHAQGVTELVNVLEVDG